MDCREAERFGQLALDEEIEATDSAALDRHLEHCARCKDSFDRERWFQARLRDRLRSAQDALITPSAAKERILGNLAKETPRGPPVLRIFAIAAGVVVLVGLSYGGSEQPTIFEESVERHSSNLPPEVRSFSGREEVRRFLEGHLRRPVSVPEPARADLPVRLVGARLSSIKDRDVAYVMYDHRGAKMSLFAVPTQETPREPPGFEQKVVGDRVLFVGTKRGYNVVAWKDRGTFYSLVSDVDSAELVEVAASLR
ncbi:MAG: hypothetical protein U1E65_14185 [Myxococcota bacterium]